MCGNIKSTQIGPVHTILSSLRALNSAADCCCCSISLKRICSSECQRKKGENDFAHDEGLTNVISDIFVPVEGSQNACILPRIFHRRLSIESIGQVVCQSSISSRSDVNLKNFGVVIKETRNKDALLIELHIVCGEISTSQGSTQEKRSYYSRQFMIWKLRCNLATWRTLLYRPICCSKQNGRIGKELYQECVKKNTKSTKKRTFRNHGCSSSPRLR